MRGGAAEWLWTTILDAFRLRIESGSRSQLTTPASDGFDMLPYQPAGACGDEPNVDPVYLSWREAVGLLAFGSLTALDEADPAEIAFFQRWGSVAYISPRRVRNDPLIERIRRVRLRVRWWILRKRLRTNSVPCPIKPLNSIDRTSVRYAIRKHAA